MTINSKRKGNRGERDAAKFLKTWTGYDFTKTPGSGGLRWHRKSDTVGDIVCSDETHSKEFNLAIEVKFYQSLDWNLFSKSPNILDFWDQCQEQSAGKVPFLMIRQNGMPKGEFYIGVRPSELTILRNIGLKKPWVTFRGKYEEIAIIPSSSLLKTSYSSFHAIIRG